MICLQIEDTAEELNAKCLQLAQAIRNAKSVVLYTGAGISTVGVLCCLAASLISLAPSAGGFHP